MHIRLQFIWSLITLLEPHHKLFKSALQPEKIQWNRVLVIPGIVIEFFLVYL